MRPSSIALALFTVGLVAACGATQGEPGPTGRSADAALPSEDDAVAPDEPTADISEEGLAALVLRAAEEAGVDVGEVRVLTAEAVTWPDGSLGCPEPGQMYTQALVEGFRVVLEIDGEQLSFHAARGGEFRFCEDPQRPASRDAG